MPTRNCETGSRSAFEYAGTGRSSVMASSGSKPARTSSISAASSTVLAMGPTLSSEYADGTMPRVLTRPNDVLKPTTPQCAPGMRTDPPSSVPTEAKQRPSARAADEPDDDPPVILSRFHGFRVGPYPPVVPDPAKANSSRFSLPNITAPARFTRFVT